MGSEVITLYYAGARTKKVYSTPHPPGSDLGGLLFRYDAPSAYPIKHFENYQEGSIRIAQNENTGEYCIVRRKDHEELASGNLYEPHVNNGYLDLITNDCSWGCSVPFQQLIKDRTQIRNIMVCDVTEWDEDMFLIVGSVVMSSQPTIERAFRAFITGSQDKNIAKTFSIVRMDIYPNDQRGINWSTCLTGIAQKKIRTRDTYGNNNITSPYLRTVAYTGVSHGSGVHSLRKVNKNSYSVLEYFSDKHNGLDPCISRAMFHDHEYEFCTQPTRPTIVQVETTLVRVAFGFGDKVKFHNYKNPNHAPNHTGYQRVTSYSFNHSGINSFIGYSNTHVQYHVGRSIEPGKTSAQGYKLNQAHHRANVYTTTNFNYSALNGYLNFNYPTIGTTTTNAGFRALNLKSNQPILGVHPIHITESGFYGNIVNTVVHSVYELDREYINAGLKNISHNIVFIRNYSTTHPGLMNGSYGNNRAHSLFEAINGDQDPISSLSGSNPHFPRSLKSSLAFLQTHPGANGVSMFPVQCAAYCDCRYRGPGSLTKTAVSTSSFSMEANYGQGTIVIQRAHGYNSSHYVSETNTPLVRMYLVRPKVKSNNRDLPIEQFWPNESYKFALYFTPVHSDRESFNNLPNLNHRTVVSSATNSHPQSTNLIKPAPDDTDLDTWYSRKILSMVNQGSVSLPNEHINSETQYGVTIYI